MIDGAAHAEGRRPKASRGGNRAGGNVWGCRGRYGDLSAAGAACELRPIDRAHRSAMMQWLSGSSRPNGDELIGKRAFPRGSRCVPERAAPWPVEERQGRRALRYCDVAMVVMRCRF